MSQGFVNNIAIPLSVAQGGTGAVTADDARTNLGISNNPQANVIIGGNFDTNPWQRGTSFTSPATNTFTADRFSWKISGTGVVNITRTADAPSVGDAEMLVTNCLHVDVTTDDAALAATDVYGVDYRIEGYDYAQLAQKSFTLSFWHKHTKTGTYCVGFYNSNGDRTYVGEYTQSVSDTWEKATITVTASPSAGTWNYTNGIGLGIRFILAAGSNYQVASANTWQSAVTMGLITSSQVNGMDSTANNFKLALIKIESGSTATDYPVELESDVLTRALRYCFVMNASSQASVNAYFDTTTVVKRGVVQLPVYMRGAPSVTQSGTTSNFNIERPGTSTASAASLQAATNLTNRSVALNWTSASVSTIGYGTALLLTSDAVITIDAEL